MLRSFLLSTAFVLCGVAVSTASAEAQTKYYARQQLAGLASTEPSTPTPPPSSTTFRWDAQTYGDWSDTCSSTAVRTRVVNCLDSNDAVVGDDKCASQGSKPLATQGPQVNVSDCSALIRNGGFENDFANWSPGGSTFIVASSSVGAKAAQMTSGSTGWVSQTFATIPGVRYTVSYMVSRTVSSIYFSSSLRDGATNNRLAIGSYGTDNVYTRKNMSAVATSNRMYVEFAVTVQGGSYAMKVDDVSLTASQ